MAKPEEVLAGLAADLVETLGDQLLSLALHGSWALGDFTRAAATSMCSR